MLLSAHSSKYSRLYRLCRGRDAISYPGGTLAENR
ncbi:Uncharacterised protein [Vibrio cholerae]|nr:Uncharacterised protein [Vibrio cholerae]